MDKALIEKFVQEKSPIFTDVSDQIWDFAEIAFQEYRSADLHCRILEQQGFSVVRNLGGIETAIMGSYGSGSPVIGILGEYDALPGLSQKSGIAEERPIAEKECGHGCGHNLLGAGALAAAVVLKDYMEKKGLPGTIKYFGCPGEEERSGKAYMVREGCFEGLSICLSWHPAYINFLFNQALSIVGASFSFKGISAHASGEPEKGRSALDAAELMNVGANYLREHIISGARLHYAYQNAGSKFTNIVHPEAEIQYTIRAPKQADAREIFERVCNIAKGAALMTDTQVTWEIVSSYADIIPNETLDKIMLKYMEEYFITYTQEELDTAEGFRQKGTMSSAPESLMHSIIRERVPAAASTDVGDVSWHVPTSQCGIACYAMGSASHSWTVTAQGKCSYAHKGMLMAAKILASVGAEVLEDPGIVQKAKEEHRKAVGNQIYHTFLPADSENVKKK